MHGEAMQQIAFALDIPSSTRAARAVPLPPFVLEEGLKQQLQEAQLERVHARVFHQFGVAQRGDFACWTAGDSMSAAARAEERKSGMASMSR